MQECLLHNKKKELCFLDSGCSRHIPRDKNKFVSLEKRKDRWSIAFGDYIKMWEITRKGEGSSGVGIWTLLWGKRDISSHLIVSIGRGNIGSFL